MCEFQIGERWVGDGHPCYIIGEIGINHNGDIDIAKELIRAAAVAGCDAVKFQKRTVDVVYTQADLARPRESVFGKTNGDLKRGLEFGREQYQQIDDACCDHGIQWLASCWDEDAVDFIDSLDVPCFKVASASLTDVALLHHTASKGKPIIISSGMSSMGQIDRAMECLESVPVGLLHCVATYPATLEDLNLRCLDTLYAEFGGPVGYSGHELGTAASVAAVAMGASILERHITLNPAMWGSDQSASIDPLTLRGLVRDVRMVETALGDGEKRVLPAEAKIAEKLRRK